MNETIFHLVFVISFVAFTAIRMYYNRLARKTEGKVTFKEGGTHRTLRALFGIPYILLLFVYMFIPSILGWARIDLPEAARWVGAVLAVITIPLIYWVQWALGSNFSTTLHVRDAHTLVEHGPYRWVRHPMYTVLYLQAIGLLLLTANLFIGGIYLLALTLVVISRVNNEEQAMIEKFGEEYRRYMLRTGRFLPKV